MTRVKICGIRTLEDAMAAVELGAHALGFVLHPASRRFIEPETAAEIIRQLPPYVQTVAVYAHRPEGAETHETPFDAVQFITTETPAPRRSIRAFPLKGPETAHAILQHTPHQPVLLDAYHPALPGGTGERCDWDLAADIRRRISAPLILAGGLHPENVADAVKTVRPYAVDVASGVENKESFKDHAKIRDFIAAVNEATRSR